MFKFFVFFSFLIFFSFKAIAVSGVADKYEVTMNKVELCTSSACSSPTTVASGSQAVNIASLSAGAEAGAFGSTAGLPIGTTFTHIRVTLNRAFTIEGEVNVSGNNWNSPKKEFDVFAIKSDLMIILKSLNAPIDNLNYAEINNKVFHIITIEV